MVNNKVREWKKKSKKDNKLRTEIENVIRGGSGGG
jgi:hypothetical protein